MGCSQLMHRCWTLKLRIESFLFQLYFNQNKYYCAFMHNLIHAIDSVLRAFLKTCWFDMIYTQHGRETCTKGVLQHLNAWRSAAFVCEANKLMSFTGAVLIAEVARTDKSICIMMEQQLNTKPPPPPKKKTVGCFEWDPDIQSESKFRSWITIRRTGWLSIDYVRGAFWRTKKALCHFQWEKERWRRRDTVTQDRWGQTKNSNLRRSSSRGWYLKLNGGLIMAARQIIKSVCLYFGSLMMKTMRCNWIQFNTLHLWIHYVK